MITETSETAESSPRGAVAPIRRDVRVQCDTDTAFELFTAHLAAWWPLGTHTGWERLAEPAAAREEYNSGWPHVLAGFGQLLEAETEVDASADGDGEGDAGGHEWFALHHRPGAAISDGDSVFAHPLFAEHVAFLGRLRERGWLVAAGPVDAANGEGMAVVRVPAGSGPTLEELAREDDASVAGGALTVSIQPWDVRFTGAN